MKAQCKGFLYYDKDLKKYKAVYIKNTFKKCLTDGSFPWYISSCR